MRTLYLPIVEPGDNHAVALVNKRGLRDALEKYGPVTQLDYLAIPQSDLFGIVCAMLSDGEYGMLFTQLHGADRLTPDNLRLIRERFPSLKIVNWSGDSWLHSLTAQPMLDLCRHFDLQLVAAPDVLPVYAEHGIRAHFWQIGYEAPIGPLPEMPAYDVVMLGNVISEKRRKLFEFLRTLKDVKVGIYGDWEHADGRCTYNFGAGEALYKNAKIAVADAAYVDQKNYVSNRPIQVLMAGGAVLLHEYVEKMSELLGLDESQHYFGYSTNYGFRDLESIIYELLSTIGEPGVWAKIGSGQGFARAHHTYDVRTAQLFEEFLPELERV